VASNGEWSDSLTASQWESNLGREMAATIVGQDQAPLSIPEPRDFDPVLYAKGHQVRCDKAHRGGDGGGSLPCACPSSSSPYVYLATSPLT
jgi:hypothetical protein